MAAKRVSVPRAVLDNPEILNDSHIRGLLTSKKPPVAAQRDEYEPCEIEFEIVTSFDYDKALPVIDKFKWRTDSDARFKNNTYAGPYYYKAEEAVFAGQMNKGIREGRGFLSYADGSLYEGYFERDTTNICGRVIFDNGDVFEGEISDRNMNGNGIYYNNSAGSKYTGQFKDDMPHGKGKEEWEDGTFYEGGFSEGSKHGKGLFRTKEGSIYEGEFKKGAFSGKGTFTTANKTKIKGTWKSAELQSPAEITYEDGKTYQGDVNKDMKPHGNGVILGPKKRYSGTFKNGSLDGEVITTYPGGESRRSVYKEGIFVKWVEMSELETPFKSERESSLMKATSKHTINTLTQINGGIMANPVTPQLIESSQPRQSMGSSKDTSKAEGEKKPRCLCC